MQTNTEGGALDTTRRSLSVHLARGVRDVLAAQRLRYRVFSDELGAALPHESLGIDRDRFDRWCDHLIVRDDTTGDVVGTYRILPGDRAERTDGLYCETEFDTRRLQALGHRLIEVGRACIHPDHRNGAVLALLWSGLGQYIQRAQCKYVIGCASVPVGESPDAVAATCRTLLDTHASEAAWRVVPYCPFPLATTAAAPAPLPTLLRGYLRMGAKICGAPAWDETFRTADLLLLLSVEEMNARYAARIFRAA